ncbi:MAG: hypothetical protein KC425_03130 [Anaerolineales bacterium]|nr:hypothetical protein [Anaerolineales bacterium]
MTVAIDWLKPAALWQENGLDFRQLDFFRPQLFEYRTDSFMDQFLADAAAPQPAALTAALAPAPPDSAPLKLFQPLHGCFYLVGASLCCRLPAFPDRQVRLDEEESTFFVLRKLIDGVEYAWAGADGQRGWQPLNGQARRLLPDEDRQPLFPALAANGRSLQFGYLPVASRDTYAVPAAELAAGTPLTDLRLEELGSRFAAPLTRPNPTTPSIIENTPAVAVRAVSVYLLLDLWEFLLAHVAPVALALRDDPTAVFSGDKSAAQAALMAFLQGEVLGGGLTLAAALGEVAQQQAALDASDADPAALGFGSSYELDNHGLDLPGLLAAVGAALPDEAPPPVQLPKLGTQPEAQYVLRCVYERPQCDPPIVVVSQPSRPFQFAPFFDTDAPARTIRIPLPADVSLSAMRKYKKGVSFMMSDAMRKKVEMLTGKEKSLVQDDPPSLNPEGGGLFAFICSFSIQIIFIVAFFLLIMFVVILDFVFWWMAFFKICFPVPKALLPE